MPGIIYEVKTDQYVVISHYNDTDERVRKGFQKVNKALKRLDDLVYYKEVKTSIPYKKLIYATPAEDIPDGEES